MRGVTRVFEFPPLWHVKELDYYDNPVGFPSDAKLVRCWRKGSDTFTVWRGRKHTYIRRQSDDGSITPTWWRFKTQKRTPWRRLVMMWEENSEI